MWSILSALVAAFCWGIAPIAAKLALRNVSPLVGMGVRSAVTAVFFSAWLLPSGHVRLIANLGGRSMTWLFVEAMLATVIGDGLYFYALKHSHAGQASLIMATSPLFTLLIGVLLLGEPLSAGKVIGAALVIGGLVLVSI